MDTLQKLRDLGLWVKCSSDGRLYYINEMREGATTQEFAEYLKTLPPYSLVSGEWFGSCHLSIIGYDDGWYLSRSDYVPGPGPDDFFKVYSTEDEALVAALNYFTGEPTVLEEWLLPFHRHPELDPDQVQQTIQSAKQLSVLEFEPIKEERWSALGDDWRSRPFQGQFLDIPHQTDPSIILKLRRDTQEAFVVSL